MGRVDLDAVGKHHESLGQASVEIRRRRLASKVRATDIADEERIAREHEPWLATAGEIRHEDRDAVRRVPRRVEDLEADRPDGQLVSVLDRRIGVGRLRCGVDTDAGAALGRQGLGTGHVVGVHVGLDDLCDRQPLAARQRHVIVHSVPTGIDYQRPSDLPATDQIGEAARFLVDHLLEDHDEIFPQGSRATQAASLA